MQKAILVTSVIWPENDVPLNFGNRRSAFTARERLIQTVATLHSLQLQQPDAMFFFCDASVPDYSQVLRPLYHNVRYLHLHEYNPQLAERVRTAGNKSIGECQMLLSLWEAFKSQILEADFVMKATGRYMYENFHDQFFVEENLDKYLFTYDDTDEREWVDFYGLDWSLAKNPCNPTEKRRILRTVLYGMGRYQVGRYFEALRNTVDKLSRPEYWFYDIENMLPCELGDEIASGKLKTVDWRYLGWNGVTGELRRM